jgi:hypothetical protein
MKARILPIVTILLASFAAVLTGCDQGAEGDRCNPDLVDSNECNGNLVCTQPASCPENYCCPPDGGASSNPNCQPGCNGGALSICEAKPDALLACIQADAVASPPPSGDAGTDATISSSADGGNG